MTYRVLENGVERDATPEEAAEIEARMNAPVVVPPHEIRKLLLIDRIPDEALDAFKARIDSLSLRDRLRWDGAVMIASDDAQVRGFLSALGLDPDVILAPET